MSMIKQQFVARWNVQVRHVPLQVDKDDYCHHDEGFGAIYPSLLASRRTLHIKQLLEGGDVDADGNSCSNCQDCNAKFSQSTAEKPFIVCIKAIKTKWGDCCSRRCVRCHQKLVPERGYQKRVCWTS